MAIAREDDPMRVVAQNDEPVDDPLRLDAMRSWLLNGMHLVDSRRRFGSHGRARELLVLAKPVSRTASDRWQALAAALHRHTVRGGLSELSADQRRVITLAYLEGRTNREIAAMLGVSVATVRRRLMIALGLLEAYIGRGGAWLSALMLIAAAYALRPATRAGNWVTTAATSSDRTQRLATTLTAGAISAAILGTVAFTSGSGIPSKSPQAAAPFVAQTSVGALSAVSIGAHKAPPSSAQPALVVPRIAETRKKADAKDTAPTAGGRTSNGCDGNPTSAPPAVPVRSHGSGSPVTHPDAGGCGAQG